MQRLSLAELKAKSANDVVADLEAIKGGNTDGCHSKSITWQDVKDALINAYESGAFFSIF